MGLVEDTLQRIANNVQILRGKLYYKSFINPKTEKQIVTAFHKLYYESALFDRTWMKTYWMGTKILKCPLDCWVYQEIMFEQKPDVIIETGTAHGGSAHYLASLCDVLGKGKIITVDTQPDKNRPYHKRITYLLGSSTDPKIIQKIKKAIKPKDKVLVILDSDHRRDHVIEELRIYSNFVKKGGYIIAEDTNNNGHPVAPDSGPGPMEAVEIFLKENKNFKPDKSREKLLLTFNPNGFLKRVK